MDRCTARINAKCRELKESMTVVTATIIDQQKELLKASVVTMHRRIQRAEEGTFTALKDIEQADIEIAAQSNNDREVRRIIEERYASSIAQLSTHKEGLELKCNEQINVNNALKRRRILVHEMLQELFAKRTNADP